VLLGWQQALSLAAVLGVGWALLGLGSFRARPWIGEIVVLLVSFAVWQWALGRFANHLAGAAAHGLWVWRAERWMHLPSERSVQRLALRAPWLVRALNYYYADVHVQDVMVCLAWVWWRHRSEYLWARRSLLLLTLGTFVLQLIPVAPPRLLPSTGVVDAGRLLGYAIYSPAGLHDSSQVIAMPSVHCAWALWVAVVVVCVSRSRWRWLVVLHPIVTTAAVIVTGYHFWLDAVVAYVLVAVAVVVVGRIGVRPILEPCPTP